MWVVKHKPGLDEIEGQDEAVKVLKSFVKGYGSGSSGKGACVLYGASGVGKTALVYAVASSLGLEVVELNSSQVRSKKSVCSFSEGCFQASLFAKGKIILIDEVDNLGRSDRGGAGAIKELIRKSVFPVVFTANDILERKLSSLKRSCLVVEMNELKVFEIVKVLRRICLKEGIEVSEGVLGDVAVRCKGDVRAAINDLQVAYMVGFSKLGIGEREREGEIEGALRSVFNGCTRLDVFDNVGEDLDGCFLWIDENMPLEFFGSSLVRGYEMLSMADLFRGRIVRRQYWRFLSYVNAFLSAGIGCCFGFSERKGGMREYKRNSRILKMWIARQRNARKREAAEKVAEEVHCSVKKVLKDWKLLEMFVDFESLGK